MNVVFPKENDEEHGDDEGAAPEGSTFASLDEEVDDDGEEKETDCSEVLGKEGDEGVLEDRGPEDSEEGETEGGVRRPELETPLEV